MLFTPPFIALFLTIFQVSGTNDTNERPGLSDKHDEEVSTFKSIAVV